VGQDKTRQDSQREREREIVREREREREREIAPLVAPQRLAPQSVYAIREHVPRTDHRVVVNHKVAKVAVIGRKRQSRTLLNTDEK
jgi:hypothetical protein